MTSVVDLAKLSNAVYNDTVKVEQWLRVGLPITQAGSGFKSALFQHMQSGDYALAIAGTEADLDDLKSDVQIFFGSIPNQHRFARNAYHFSMSLTGGFSGLYVTGHSLGGGLASMLGKEHGEPTVTFNAPGMARSYASFEASEPGVTSVKDDNRKVLHIRAAFDVVSVGTGKHMGKDAVKSVYTSPVGTKEVLTGVATSLVFTPAVGAGVTTAMAVKKAHGIERLIPVLEKKSEYTEALGWT